MVDLFCGSGGLSLGAREAAIAVGLRPKTLVAADMDGEAIEVYRRNFSPVETVVGNVASLVDYHTYGRGSEAEFAYAPELLDPKLNRLVGKVDLLVAGPPCQGHSNLNNRTRRDDPRNQLYVATVAIGIALKAKALVIENVPDVVKDSTDVVTTAITVLEANGYKVSHGVLSAPDLGGGQTRRRHFTIATKGDHLPIKEAANFLKKAPMTLKETIGDLESRDAQDLMDQVPQLSAENQERINYLFEHDLFDLPNQVRPDCHKNGHTYPSVYGRLSWDKPSQTITTGFLTPGRGRYIHPSQRRVLTPREAARIQGFPDWFDFIGKGESPSRSSLSKWIGDAVPTPLGYAAVLAALSGV
jgi:DNA (cytosine-5)-methyltransferase 1